MEVLAGRIILVPLVVVEPAVPEELRSEMQLSQLDVGVESSH